MEKKSKVSNDDLLLELNFNRPTIEKIMTGEQSIVLYGMGMVANRVIDDMQFRGIEIRGG